MPEADDDFRVLFERHHAFIYRFLYCLVGDAHLAQELTQETFFRAFRARQTFHGDSAASTWLCGIARNVARNFARSARRSRFRLASELPAEAAAATGTSPDRELLSRELREAIRVALLELDDAKREAFTLKVLQRRSYEEIAAITGDAVAKLKTNVHRARQELRALLAPYLGQKR